MGASHANSGAMIIMVQDFLVGLAVVGHDRRTDLAQAYAMSPPGSLQYETAGFFVHGKRGAVKMRAGQGTPNLQFLTDDYIVTFSYDAEPVYST